jgi:hypothetical protein
MEKMKEGMSNPEAMKEWLKAFRENLMPCLKTSDNKPALRVGLRELKLIHYLRLN